MNNIPVKTEIEYHINTYDADGKLLTSISERDYYRAKMKHIKKMDDSDAHKITFSKQVRKHFSHHQSISYPRYEILVRREDDRKWIAA
jgi:hypothetical protein